MRKYVLLPLLLLFAIPAFSDDKAKDDSIAPITSFTPLVGQKLQYSSAQVVSGTQTYVTEEITVKKLKPNIEIEVRAYLGDTEFENKKLDYTPIPQEIFEKIVKHPTAETKIMVLNHLRFKTIKFRIEENTYWFVTDGDRNIFPGILRIVMHHDDHEHVTLQLKKIIQPTQ